MINYQLADLAVRFNVGGRNYYQRIALPRTVLSLTIASIFLRQGLIQSFVVKHDKIEVKLKYFKKKPFLKELNVVSTPGKRVYWKLTNLSKTYNAHSLACFYIISTTKGIYTSNECISGLGTGGEVLYKVVLN